MTKLLESVGVVVDDDGMTYQLDLDGPVKKRLDEPQNAWVIVAVEGIHLDDIAVDDWWDALSFEDTRTVLDIYRKIRYSNFKFPDEEV